MRSSSRSSTETSFFLSEHNRSSQKNIYFRTENKKAINAYFFVRLVSRIRTWIRSDSGFDWYMHAFLTKNQHQFSDNLLVPFNPVICELLRWYVPFLWIIIYRQHCSNIFLRYVVIVRRFASHSTIAGTNRAVWSAYGQLRSTFTRRVG